MCPHATETVSPRQLLVACSYTMTQVWAVLDREKGQSRTNHAPGASWVVSPAHAPLPPFVYAECVYAYGRMTSSPM